MISLDGKQLALEIEESLTKEIKALIPEIGRSPKFLAVLVGKANAESPFVKTKIKRAASCGILVEEKIFSDDVSKNELNAYLSALNESKDIDGVLLQLPLPVGLDANVLIDAIPAKLDIDGLTRENLGKLFLGQSDYFLPPTPHGCLRLIELAKEKLGQEKNLSGQNVVVIGRSRLVGHPLSAMLLNRNCTVTVCHSKTENLEAITAAAEIVVSACGVPGIIKSNAIKKGAIVIDVGLSYLGNKAVGDVDFDSVSQVASAITPVPGGVGPMTVAMLLWNIFESYKTWKQI